ncbi:MAG: T9SS type A sorting domain-containing protein [Saprospiraceae bacterium]|nr:T9SS type A sorting domain-containing protein [Saprospiraceae bacterium]
MVKTDFFYSERRSYIPRIVLFFALTFLMTLEITAQALACNDNVQVSLNFDCEANITPAMILEGEDNNLLPNYIVEIEGIAGTIVSSPGVYSVTVTDITNDNSCWGNITVEDKLAPVIDACDCPVGNTDPNCEFLCTDLDGILDGTVTVPQPLVTENCGSYTAEFSDQISDGGCGEKIITRDWLFTDDAGNQATGCTQEFRTLAVSTSDIVAPISPVILPCGSDVSMPAIVDYFTPSVGATAAAAYGYPTANGVAISGAICNLVSSKTDVVIPVCDQACSNSIKVLRNWVVLDWCTAESIEFTQVIKAIDEEAPTIDAKDITVSTDPWVCEGNFFLPAPLILHDNCTDFVEYEVTGPAGVIIIWDAQANLYFATGAPKGIHTFNYIASDCCSNTAIDPITVSVVDQTAPVAVAKQNIVVSLTQAYNGQGQAKIFANSVDNGSHDGCTGVHLEIRRDNDECGVVGNATYNNDGHSFDASNDPDQGQFVKFCCDDLTNAEVDVDGDGENDPGYVKVWLRVWDDGDMNGSYGTSGDNYNETWAFVKVEDKLQPIINCPADISVECDVDCEDLSIVGEATATTTCGDVDVEYTDIINTLNSCNVGYITRRWSVVGQSSVFCDQIITKTEDNLFNGNINWPNDYTTDCTDLDGDDNVPTWADTGCSLVGYNVESDTFLFEDGACFKIINYWSVIDWCQYDPNSTSNDGMWNHIQIIKVLDDEAPVLNCPNQMYAVDDFNDADNDGDQCESIGLMLTNTADDNGDCSSAWLKWTVLVDLWGDGEYDYEYSSYLPSFDSNFNDTNGNGIPDRYLAPTASGEEVKVTLPEDIAGSMSNHKVSWKVSDGCQNITSCENTFMVVDKKAPTPYCIDISTALMESGMVELWACDFDLGSFDNCTEEGDLRFTFTDTKPQNDPNYNSDTRCSSKIFDCDDLENSPVSVTMYVWDEKDNFDFCEVMLTLIDNQGGCENGGGMKISGSISTPSNDMVEDAMVTLFAPTIELDKNDMTNELGVYTFVNNPDSYSYQIKANKEGNYLDGVSTLDLVMIQRHILGLAEFEDAYDIIASDINNDEKITASDLLQLRKLILGVIDEYPANESYRFISAEQSFNTVTHPWPLEEDLIIDPLDHDMSNQNFKAIKIGDVNGNATYGISGLQSSATRSNKDMTILLDEYQIISGETYTFNMYANEAQNLSGLQIALKVKDLEVIEITGGSIDLSAENMSIQKEDVKISWSSMQSNEVNKGDVLFSITVRAKQTGSISEKIVVDANSNIASEAYDYNLNVTNIELQARATEIVSTFEMYQNEPNPFDEQTTIRFMAPDAGKVQLSIVDIAGRQLYNSTKNVEKGENVFIIEGEDLGHSGIYYYTISTKDINLTKKMIFVK